MRHEEQIADSEPWFSMNQTICIYEEFFETYKSAGKMVSTRAAASS